MNKENKQTTPISGADRQKAWRERNKPKQLLAWLPPVMAAEFLGVLHEQGKTYQGWVKEQAEAMTKERV